MMKRWLLGLAGLVAACGGDGDGEQGDTTGTPPTSSSADGGDGFDPTTGDEPKADLGVTVPDECTLSCDLRVACLGEAEADCLLACTDAYDANAETSNGCLAAYESLLACVAGLDCEQAVAHQMGVGDYPCATEELALPAACGDAPPSNPVCDALCATTAMCTEADETGCQTLCLEALASAEALSATCLDAQSASFSCLGALSCEEYAAWESGEGEYPCRAEDESLSLQCQGEPK